MGSNFLEPLAACRYGPGAHITEVSAKVEASPWSRTSSETMKYGYVWLSARAEIEISILLL